MPCTACSSSPFFIASVNSGYFSLLQDFSPFPDFPTFSFALCCVFPDCRIVGYGPNLAFPPYHRGSRYPFFVPCRSGNPYYPWKGTLKNTVDFVRCKNVKFGGGHGRFRPLTMVDFVRWFLKLFPLSFSRHISDIPYFFIHIFHFFILITFFCAPHQNRFLWPWQYLELVCSVVPPHLGHSVN